MLLRSITTGRRCPTPSARPVPENESNLMKIIPDRWLLPALLILLPACSSPPPPLALQPVGPAPVGEAKASDQGRLLVYSAWDLFNEYKSPVDHHSSYTVTSASGGPVRHVLNHL